MNKMLLLVRRSVSVVGLSLLPLSASSMETIQFNRSCYQAPVGVDLYRSGLTFFAGSGQNISEIHGWNIDKKLNDMDMPKLAAMLQGGYLKVSQLSDGEYKLEAHARGLGGGPIAGSWAYGITKGACWSIVIGVIGGVLSRKAPVDSETARDVVTTHVGGTMREYANHATKTVLKAPVQSQPIGSVIGTIARKKIGEEDSKLIVAMGGVASGGKIAAAIEGISAFVGGVFTAIPWLP